MVCCEECSRKHQSASQTVKSSVHYLITYFYIGLCALSQDVNVFFLSRVMVKKKKKGQKVMVLV